MKILAIETSCDETAAAVVEDGTKIISNAIASSAHMHRKYGGIVPEVAARKQLECILSVIAEVLQPLIQDGSSDQHLQGDPLQQSIDAVAVTVGPGLIAGLLVGVETAKTIAFATGKPIIPVNHVLAHMYANFVSFEQNWKSQISNLKSQTIQQYNNITIEYPAISLVASGGHTELYLMKSIKDLKWLGGTLDDAAGECFDKTARLLGFGTGGGLAIEKAAKNFKIKTLNFKLPRPMLDESWNFSFSGLKTAVIREWNKYEKHDETVINSFAYEIQEAITDVLVKKTLRAAQKYEAKTILLSGGVASNSRLREKFKVKSLNFKVVAPPAPLCTDNAVYIASYAFFRGKPTDWHKITAVPDLSVEAS